jgi:hypothetical protein
MEYLILYYEPACYPKVISFNIGEIRDMVYEKDKKNGYYFEETRNRKIFFSSIKRANILKDVE